jgi:hypothetical protein
MKIIALALATALVCACKTYHHEEKGQSKFFEEVSAADPSNAEQAKTAAKASVSIVSVIAQMPAELAAEIFGKSDWDGTIFGPKEAPDIDALVKAHAAVEIVDRPGVTVPDGGTSKIVNAKPVPFTQGFTVGEHGELHPVAGSIEEGVWFTATPKLDRTLELVDFKYTIQRTILERPFAEKSELIGKTNRSAMVQVPAVSTLTAAGHRRLQSGQTLAVELKSNPPSVAGKRVSVALITVTFWNP